MNTINWGIIGCGDVCEIKSGPAFYKTTQSRLVAVMRRNGALAADFAQRHGVARWYDDAQALIDDPEVNALYIATPPSSHEQYALAAMAAGKPVYVEKPMAHTAASAQRITDAARASHAKICVAHYRRQQPLFLKVKQLLMEGSIGTVRNVQLRYSAPTRSFNLDDPRVQWRLNAEVSGGGIFHDLAPHQLDLLFYFFGAPVEVQGMAINNAGLYDVPDSVGATLLLPKGVLAHCCWLFSAADDFHEDFCQINGAQGYIRFPVFSSPKLEVMRDGEKTELAFDPLPHVQQPMIAAVTRFFLGEGPNPCDAADGVLVMETIEAITK